MAGQRKALLKLMAQIIAGFDLDTDDTNTSRPFDTLQPESPVSVASNAMTGLTLSILMYGVQPALAVWAFFSNLVNVAVFARMGTKDGLTWTFLTLSVSDGILAFLLLVKNCCAVITAFLPRWSVTEQLLGIVGRICLVGTNYPLNASLVTTTVIALVRGCCVAMPLNVGRVFTARRQMLAIAVFTCVVCSGYIYANTFYNLVSEVDRRTNVSSIKVTFTAQQSQNAVDTFRNVAFYTGLSTISASAIILIVALNRSGRFRRQVDAPETNARARNLKRSTQQENAMRREAKIVKSVLLVLIIFIFCNFPLVLLSLARLSGVKWNRVTARLLVLVSMTCLELNVGLNVFVYYFINTRYRNFCKALFLCNAKT